MTAKKSCLLIDSRDAFERNGGGFVRELALQLAQDQVPVALLLVNNGVLAARPGANVPALIDLARLGITVLADEFSLRERGIDPQRLAPGVAASGLEVVIDRMVEGWQVIWH